MSQGHIGRSQFHPIDDQGRVGIDKTPSFTAFHRCIRTASVDEPVLGGIWLFDQMTHRVVAFDVSGREAGFRHQSAQSIDGQELLVIECIISDTVDADVAQVFAVGMIAVRDGDTDAPARLHVPADMRQGGPAFLPGQVLKHMLGHDMSYDALPAEGGPPVFGLGNVQPLFIGRVLTILMSFRGTKDDLETLSAQDGF